MDGRVYPRRPLADAFEREVSDEEGQPSAEPGDRGFDAYRIGNSRRASE
jgi:hypothetical protein